MIDEFPAAEIELPAPVGSIVSIKYDDGDGFEQTVSSGDYYLDSVPERGSAWVFPEAGWPATFDAINAVRVRFMGGYATPDDVPQPLKEVIHLRVQEFYEATDNERAVRDLLMNFYDIAV